jgi:hypothetical protein
MAFIVSLPVSSSLPASLCSLYSLCLLGDTEHYMGFWRNPQAQWVDTNPKATGLGNGHAVHIGTAFTTSKGNWAMVIAWVEISARRAQDGTILGTIGGLQGARW